jgi:hypothetical protein
MSFLDRYRAGERAQVWRELMALGAQVREPSLFPDAYAVAIETMTIARQNVEILVERLAKAGYRFNCRESVHVPPTENTPREIEEVDTRLGPLPLSLRAFYEVVGSVDFVQSWKQLIHYHKKERESATEIEILGEEDPLVVAPLSLIGDEKPKRGGRVYFCFAPDEVHKANYSGGENYHVWIPDPRSDFEIVGMYEIEETFVEYLRATFAYGGFRGRVETLPDDESRCRKAAPTLDVVQFLAEGLAPL